MKYLKEATPALTGAEVAKHIKKGFETMNDNNTENERVANRYTKKEIVRSVLMKEQAIFHEVRIDLKEAVEKLEDQFSEYDHLGEFDTKYPTIVSQKRLDVDGAQRRINNILRHLYQAQLEFFSFQEECSVSIKSRLDYFIEADNVEAPAEIVKAS